ncbi:MAG TPA: TetR/AcrR family transcriptional regulator [Gammaproteobacteria bacterium]
MESPKQPDITRAQILKAAFAEIHRHGFQAASINNILADTGLTKGALYHHFPTKQALGLAVVDEVIKERFKVLFCEPLASSARPVEVLLEVVASLEHKLSPQFIELGCPLNNLIQEMSPLDEMFKQHLTDVLDMWKSSIENALREGLRQGDIRPEVDCTAATLFIIAALAGCRGVAKNLRSSEVFHACMQQLHGYIAGLRIPGK